VPLYEEEQQEGPGDDGLAEPDGESSSSNSNSEPSLAASNAKPGIRRRRAISDDENDQLEADGDEEAREEKKQPHGGVQGSGGYMMIVKVLVDGKATRLELAEEVGVEGDIWFYGKVAGKSGILGPAFVDDADGCTQFYEVEEYPRGWGTESCTWVQEHDNIYHPAFENIEYEVEMHSFSLTDGYRLNAHTKRAVKNLAPLKLGR
jgi:hypothetical protein